MKFLKYDISFILIGILSFAFIVIFLYFYLMGSYHNAYSRVEGINKVLFHYGFMVVPFITIYLSFIFNRETYPVWRQIKLWIAAMPLLIYGAYWFYVLFNVGLLHSMNG